MPLSTLSFELLTCVANHVSWQDLLVLSSCNKALYGLQCIDTAWRRYCRSEYGVRYNHPNQTYKELFIFCKTRKNCKRLPCNHIQDESHLTATLDQHQCQQCTTTGHENLFICIACHQTMCDRHTRQHTRLNNTHAVYYKLNTSELFCQACVDWIGGLESNMAEQYMAEMMSLQWSQYDVLQQTMRRIRQRERRQRWQDTPQYIMKTEFCFISSTWMAQWEMFVEGWKTSRPTDIIDQTQLVLSVIRLNRVGTNPFYLNSNDNVMIISSHTWDYLAGQYKVQGEKITQQHLKPVEDYSCIIKRIEYWKKRALY